MKKILVIAYLMSIYGCAASLTERAKSISIVDGLSSELVGDCERLDSVIGFAKPGWGNDVGLEQAFADARNKAGEIPNADTIAISSSIRQFNGGEVTGVVYNCREKRVQLIKNTEGQPKENVTQDVFKKAKKCQEKNGVWINNQCVINIE